MIIRQFEIWLANLNPAGGTVPGKIRPVVIIQTDYLNKVNHPFTLIMPITSKVHDKVTLLRINLEPEYLNGLKNESAILIDQIRSIDNKKLIQKIGIIEVSLHQSIKKAINKILAL